MLQAAFLVFVLASMLFAALCVPFIDSVKDEAPAIYESWGSPTVIGYVFGRKTFTPFSDMLLRRRYLAVLASYPRSRAWASWLFIAHWLQAIAFAVLVVAMIARW